ncbi:MAG TPA: integrase, partial [Xanthobacteraceae bacterium]|nr:integrase [Xanthobacteraceae bacterium]
SGEVRKATWYEFGDLAEKLWIVPAARMKAGRDARADRNRHPRPIVIATRGRRKSPPEAD